MKRLAFFFDFISPYAYLAWTQIHALAERNSAKVEPVPTLFAALLNAHGTKGPAEIPAKRAYLFKDIHRKAHALGVPIDAPATHPFNPLAALRMAAIAPTRELIDGLYRATWVEGKRVDQPKVVAEIAAHYLDAETIARGQSDEAKALVRANTERALAAGVFGVPTIVVDGELFWGVDSLPHLDAFLRGENPIPADAVARWGNLSASASRI
jgi:2-hydroxychromene-2-carboxylate isomerase